MCLINSSSLPPDRSIIPLWNSEDLAGIIVFKAKMSTKKMQFLKMPKEGLL